MAKPTILSASMLDAAEGEKTPTRGVVKSVERGKERKDDVTPLQIRPTTQDRFSMKMDAARLHFSTETAFLVECWRFYMKHHGKAE